MSMSSGLQDLGGNHPGQGNVSGGGNSPAFCNIAKGVVIKQTW